MTDDVIQRCGEERVDGTDLADCADQAEGLTCVDAGAPKAKGP
jgi:hypothetical protein